MAEKKKYNSILVSGRKDQTLTYSKYVKDEESGESVKESLDKKVNVTDELETQQIKDGAITNEKMAADSVGNTNLQDGSVSNEKLEDGSITNEKLAENSITKDKLKDNTIGVEKLDPELRQTISAATGLPENLVETIQNVDDALKDHQSQLDDKQSQIDDNQQQITANDEDISLLQTRSTQMEETIKSIAATGGASQATAVTYNNEKSKLTAVNIQSAVDEVVDKTSIKDEEGNVQDTPFRVIENEEFIMAIVDADDRILYGIYRDTGKPYFPQNDMYHISQSEEFLWVILDTANHPLLGIQQDGTCWAAKAQWLDDIKAIKEALSSIDETLKTFQPKEDGKGLINLDVADSFFYISNDEYIIAVVDREDRILAGIKYDGKPYFPLNEMYYVEQNEEFFALWRDAANHVLLGIRRDGSVILYNPDVELLKKQVSGIEDNLNKLTKVNVVDRNIDRIPALMSACRHKGGNQDFQLCIITDSHAEELSVRNAVTLCNNIGVIDAIIHCGDITAYTYDKAQANTFFNDYSKCIKPWFVVIGNHDVGNTMFIDRGATHEEVYRTFIKPMIDKNILQEGEFQEDKSYYYHDFVSRKIRLIVIYEYDNPLDVADNEYWDLIDYDQSIPQVVVGEKYNIGDKINCGGFIDYSFICKKNVETSSDTYTLPYYKVGRAARCIREEQARWIVSTLKSTPSGYGVIIATHNPAMINSTNQTQLQFATDIPKKGLSEGQYAMETDLLAEIVELFINKSRKDIHVRMSSAHWGKADASYLNVIGDNDGTMYAYNLDVDFSGINNCYFVGYIGGHVHCDTIFKHDRYNHQYSINPVCAITEKANRRNADIIDIREDALCYDALTCFSCSQGRIALSRLGNVLTINAKHRDFEIINTNN